tara:strand:- start:935 stop:2089 length:1155 start_codon:yes stop_codon:yes gene_type:complete
MKMNTLIYYLRLFIKSKIIFSKPKKKDYLVLDKLYIQIFSKYLGKDNFNILKIRGEETNIYVLIYAIFKFGLKNLSLSYINSYIELSNAKYCLSFNHARIDFYKIKNFHKELKVIIFQNGGLNIKFPNQLFVKSLEKSKLEKQLLQVDFFLILNDFYKKNLFSSFIKAKYINIGSYRNNFYYKKSNKVIKNVITFISQFRLHDVHRGYKNSEFYKTEKIILPVIYNYCKKNKYKLEILGAEWEPEKEKKFYHQILNNYDWTFHKRTNKNNSYYYTDKSNIVIFVDSNLGLESLARGNKTISINYRGEFHKSYINFGYDFLNKRGRFWTNYRGSNEIHKLLNYANKTSIKKWNKDNSKIINNILEYDPDNSVFKKILANLKKNKN